MKLFLSTLYYSLSLLFLATVAIFQVHIPTISEIVIYIIWAMTLILAVLITQQTWDISSTLILHNMKEHSMFSVLTTTPEHHTAVVICLLANALKQIQFARLMKSRYHYPKIQMQHVPICLLLTENHSTSHPRRIHPHRITKTGAPT